ncbi:MAG: CRISPR system precrRNA processing endoribonuclease RAMP protein Cas6 [Acetobacteraceae bacterium]|nr:CRISPR system precrRNA processing endoribonuclease RAMP protein Cas6 [Rhodovarius sp.]MDW8397838.1 CRISPR system precrRNA processing endoribonuclease RAMP protein Cas6 [Acetobacteraceae bacterium]
MPFRLPPIRLLDFTFVPHATMVVQSYPGSAWRGAFGHALKRIVCAMRLRPCDGCALSAVCIHPAFFGGGAAEEASRPFILCPDRAPRDGLLRAGRPFRLRLTLLPSAAAVAPYAVRALLAAAENGLTARRVPLICTDMRDGATGRPFDPSGFLPEPAGQACPPAPAAVRLRFTTPLRIRLRGDLLTGDSLSPQHLVAASARRLRLLGFALPEGAAEAAQAEAGNLRFDDPRFGWLETTRFSSRQNTAMQMGGIVGEAKLDLRQAPHAWPLLWAATVLHLGKGASMGFGRIEAEAL